MDQRTTILDAVRRFAARNRGPLSIVRFLKESTVRQGALYQSFPEGWHSVLAAAGLAGRAPRRRVAPHTLFKEIDAVATRLGRVPTFDEVARLHSGNCSIAEFEDLGPPAEIIRRYTIWRRTHRPETRPPSSLRIPPGRYGNPMVWRGLLHEPVTESAVVHLAGVLWREIGLKIARIGTKFPDCEALVRSDSGTWRRVRVEFELNSRSFKDHKHNPKGCDVIVCWEHDWPECPVNVIELRAIVRRLRERRHTHTAATPHRSHRPKHTRGGWR